jgi:hypothetical protein
MRVWQQKLKARDPALSDVLLNLAGGEEHGGKVDLYCDGICSGHAIQAADNSSSWYTVFVPIHTSSLKSSRKASQVSTLAYPHRLSR